jgi:hypothetical protein
VNRIYTHRRAGAAAILLLAGLGVAFGWFAGLADTPRDAWTKPANGLELGYFTAPGEDSDGDSAIVVLRIDPALWELKLLGISLTGDERGMGVRDWCEKQGLTAAINAGMFATDYRTHVGYMRMGDHVNSRGKNIYQSVAAFDPKRDSLPLFRMFDLDVDSMAAIIRDYRSVIQNLRLIKRPGENRWVQKPEEWSEAALGEDDRGRALFIFCRVPYSMHDFNKILLSLPIGLVCAQHLEGGPEAQLYLKAGGVEIDLVGSYETGLIESGDYGWPVPNVIGIVPRKR